MGGCHAESRADHVRRRSAPGVLPWQVVTVVGLSADAGPPAGPMVAWTGPNPAKGPRHQLVPGRCGFSGGVSAKPGALVIGIITVLARPSARV